MKRCPECRRDYYDDSLLYCLDDGSALLEGPARGNEPATAPLSESPTLMSPSSGRPIPGILQHSVGHKRPATPDDSRWWNRKWLPVAIAVVLLSLGGVIGFAVYQRLGTSGMPSQPLKLERLTTNGKTSDVAISPDGKFVVYVVDEDGQQSLWIRQVTTSSGVQIIPPAHVNYRGVGFTPDGNYIHFVKEESLDTPPDLFQMPVLGGPQRKLISNIYGPVGYSPDAKQIAFLRQRYPTMEEGSLLIADPDGSNERILISIKRPEVFPSSGNQGPAWAPDGKSIVAIVRNISTNEPSVVEIQVADGNRITIPTYLREIVRLAWMPNKSGLLVLGTDVPALRPVWFVSYPTGETQRITGDLNVYFGMSLTSDARTLATVQQHIISSIWVAQASDFERPVRITPGGSNYDGIGGLAWTPDGRIVYQSAAGGTHDIWIMNGNGSGRRQLTFGGINFRPKVTSDGRYIIFQSVKLSGREEHNNIWRMDLDGSNLTKLTSGNSDDTPHVTPDSRWVVYTSKSSQDWRLWKVSIDGGSPELLTDQPARNALVSPDGKFIFCEYGSNDSQRWRKAIISLADGQLVKILDIPSFANIYRWAKDSRSITYIGSQGGSLNLSSFPLDGSSPKHLTNLTTDEVFDFDWSSQVVRSPGMWC